MLSKEQVIHIANLARIKLTDSEIVKMQKDLANILNYIDILNKADTAEVNLTEADLKENVLREDRAQENAEVGEMLSQAPQREGRHFKVREIL